MKKKLLSLLLVAAMSATMVAGCGSSDSSNASDNTDTNNTVADTESASVTTKTEDGNAELALVIDVGTIDDKSFNQGSWEGVEKYGEENGISYNYYKSAEATTDSFQNTIELAIEGGAKVIVCPGYLFEEPIYNLQDQYPDVKFILIDGEPHDADYNYATADNTMAVLYQEDQAGFLAGYAAVKDGYTNLGFMGGMALPAVIRYGYGYLAGADYAAKEMDETVNVTYTYTGSFEATPEAQSMATSWYKAGTEVIFGCGGSVGNSVMSAAEASNGKVIGVDVDQSSESDTVITSAMKMLSNSVYDAITSAYDGSFPGGKTTTFDITNDGVGIAMDTAKFNNFTQEDYQAIYDKLVAGDITIDNDTEKDVKDLSFTNLNVNVVE
ncbi:MAG: BMP family ABC transporter substrate-binding protein [Roseburia sp.]|uniref:BMP family lipoprotein n=1 Tax=Roseburia sp. 831b TaxID=1261635 RepID=UPI00095231CC|nr:BMP family ABC transporter substrate-binding protein [Roseburia sp. 831b]MDD6217360.1 BMP family ABC transporter substrate-binding protein [Roseburia sp.]MDY5881737.1 BMP family ABC transporter substrate-binding protein [Roseburia sp.]WVK74119.1 BMP family ABC transporter substrate-binding protein [Roseburia sp. 831b]